MTLLPLSRVMGNTPSNFPKFTPCIFISEGQVLLTDHTVRKIVARAALLIGFSQLVICLCLKGNTQLSGSLGIPSIQAFLNHATTSTIAD